MIRKESKIYNSLSVRGGTLYTPALNNDVSQSKYLLCYIGTHKISIHFLYANALYKLSFTLRNLQKCYSIYKVYDNRCSVHIHSS